VSNVVELKPNNTALGLSRQKIRATGSSIIASRSTDARITGAAAGSSAFNKLVLYVKSGMQRRWINHFSLNTTIDEELWSHLWNNTTDNITSLVFESLETNGLGAGSKIMLYKLRK